MKCTINRLDGSVAYESEGFDDIFNKHEAMKTTVKQALADNIDLSHTKMSSLSLPQIDFSGANLAGADFTGTDFTRANLSGCNLTGTNLTYCCLAEANLTGANLTSAILYNASMSQSKVARANFTGAILDYTSFIRVDLRDVNFENANTQSIKRDLFNVLSNARNEVSGLREALVEGRINGSVYKGKCACLIGTIANIRNVNHNKLGAELTPDAARLAERWFVAIAQGDTPANNEVNKITVKWIDEFLAA